MSYNNYNFKVTYNQSTDSDSLNKHLSADDTTTTSIPAKKTFQKLLRMKHIFGCSGESSLALGLFENLTLLCHLL